MGQVKYKHDLHFFYDCYRINRGSRFFFRFYYNHPQQSYNCWSQQVNEGANLSQHANVEVGEDEWVTCYVYLKFIYLWLTLNFWLFVVIYLSDIFLVTHQLRIFTI